MEREVDRQKNAKFPLTVGQEEEYPSGKKLPLAGSINIIVVSQTGGGDTNAN